MTNDNLIRFCGSDCAKFACVRNTRDNKYYDELTACGIIITIANLVPSCDHYTAPMEVEDE